MALDNESAELTNHYIDRPDSALSFVLGDESISLNFLNTKLIDKFSAQASGHCGYCCAQVCSRYIEWLWCKNSPELIRIDAWGPPEPFIRRAAFRTISAFVCCKLSLGHLRLARKAKIRNGPPVDFGFFLWAVPWRHHLEAGHPLHRFHWDNARPSWFALP